MRAFRQNFFSVAICFVKSDYDFVKWIYHGDISQKALVFWRRSSLFPKEIHKMPKEGPKSSATPHMQPPAEETGDGKSGYNPVLLPLEQRLDATVGKAAH